MEDKDSRRPRVPAGTFGDSTPPSTAPAAPPDDTADPAGAPGNGGADRKRFTSTLTGKASTPTGKGAFGDTDPPPAPRLTPERTGNTLVGHPSAPSPVPSGPSAPVLSPPKWRGAKPYLEGEEPQPQISSIPTPPATGDATPAGVAIGEMRSKVTTKVGQPVVEPPVPPAIDDTIQRMLETQASVPMQVEEPSEGDSIPEIPLDQLPIVELEDSLPRVPKATLEAVRAADSAAPNAAATPPDAALERAQAEAAVEAAAQGQDRPASGGGAAGGALAGSSSVVPAEVVRRPRSDDSRETIGFLLAVALFGLLFVGGWYATRGGYQPRRSSAAAPAPATAAPSGPSDLAPAPAAALTTPQPPSAEGAAPRATPAQTEDPATRSESARARSAPRTAPGAASDATARGDTKATAEGQVAAQDGVLTVTPRPDSAGLPDIPGREDVIAALEPLRPAISECSRGTHGIAQLDITVSSSGAVSHAVVGGDFAGTAEGSCIARAARNAQFAPFKKPRFRVIYPFSL